MNRAKTEEMIVDRENGSTRQQPGEDRLSIHADPQDLRISEVRLSGFTEDQGQD